MRQAEPSIEAFQEMEEWITTLRPHDTDKFNAQDVFRQAIRDLIEATIFKKERNDEGELVSALTYYKEGWPVWNALSDIATEYDKKGIFSQQDSAESWLNQTAVKWIRKEIEGDPSIIRKGDARRDLVKSWARKFGISVPQLGI